MQFLKYRSMVTSEGSILVDVVAAFIRHDLKERKTPNWSSAAKPHALQISGSFFGVYKTIKHFLT